MLVYPGGLFIDIKRSARGEAVTTTEGPLLVIGEPALENQNNHSSHFSFSEKRGYSFSNSSYYIHKQSREGDARACGKDGDRNKNEWRSFVSTFHSLGVHLLRTFGEAIGVSRYFSILDRDEQISIIKRALKELGLDPKEHEPRRIVAKISKEKGNVVSRAEYVARGERGTLARDVIAVWPIYERILARDKSLDFDDLLSKSVALLKLRPDIRSRLHETWKYLHVDEYQDTNAVQYELVRLLTGKEANLCVVGDADQLIYSWRGADSKIIMNFEKDWPTAKRILLEENYRSTATILDAANKIVEKNSNRHEKILRATKPHGEKIKIREARDEMDEARGIAEEIVSLMTAEQIQKISRYFSVRISIKSSREALLTLRIPYQVLGTRF